MNINLFALAGISVAIVCFLLALFILINAKAKHHRYWALFNIVVGIFGLGTYFVGKAINYDSAFWAWKLTLFGVSLIAMFFYLVVHEFCNLKNKRMLYAVYVHGILFASITVFTNWTFSSLRFAFNQFYYYRAGIGFNLFFSFWIIIVFKAFLNLYFYSRTVTGVKLKQTNYLFWGMLCGFAGGSTTSFPGWGINVYPAWQFFICVYISICTYAIFKYSLMDLRIVITRLGVFVAVYSIVLGIPFGLVFWGRYWLTSIFNLEWFWIPMISLLILATAGPFIYLFFQRRAENVLLQEERRLQDLLSRASIGMRTIRSLPRLMKLIVEILSKSLRLDNAAIYLHEPLGNEYVLKFSKRDHVVDVSIAKDDPLIQMLEEKKFPIVYEELKLSSEAESKSESLAEIIRQMGGLRASVIIPMVVENILLGFTVLGERKDKRVYSIELINVLMVLGNQAALAIENAMFYVEREKMLHENFERRRAESLGTLTNSISHQMSNRFHAIMQRLAIVWDIYQEGKYKEYTNEELLNYIELIGKSQERVLAIAQDGGKVTDAIQNYSKGKIETGLVNFDETVDRSIEFVQLKHTKFKFELKKEYPKDVFLWGAQALIQDIISNAVDNSCFAMKMKQKDNANYVPAITIRGRPNKTIFQFEIEDNGIGIRKENLKKVMDPMYSTRSHLDGTGMGTTIMMQFIQKHGGSIVYDSQWENWTRVNITLPLAKKDQIK